MNRLELLLAFLTSLCLTTLCGFILIRNVLRFLPLFVIYSFVLLISTGSGLLVFRYFGFYSPSSYYFYWGSLLLNAVARSLAIAELCRYGLRAYRGVWALVWRVLTFLSILLVARTIYDAWGQPNRVAIYGTIIDRDLALASIVILTVLLLFRNYYGIALEPMQRTIALGICFICVVDVIGNTVLKNIFTGYLLSFFLGNPEATRSVLSSQFQRISDLWSTIHLASFMFTVGIWCYALRKPLPLPSGAPVLLPSEVYRDLSPAINMRMATFNTRMVELLKP